jgi:DNA-directed RNA polymerase subunit RPC12/RpoP
VVVVGAHVRCSRCGTPIELVIECGCEAPTFFTATCPKCGFRDVYTYVNVVDSDPQKCEEVCREVREFRQALETLNIGKTVVLLMEKLVKALREVRKS